MKERIIQRLISRGGFYGEVAKNFGKTKDNECIIECFEQCHVKDAIEHWGVSLVLDIINYRLDLIRIPLRKLNCELIQVVPRTKIGSIK